MKMVSVELTEAEWSTVERNREASANWRTATAPPAFSVQLTAVEWAVIKGYRQANAGLWSQYDKTVERTIEFAGRVAAGESIEAIAKRFKRVTPGDVQSALAMVPGILAEYQKRPKASYPDLIESVMEHWKDGKQGARRA